MAAAPGSTGTLSCAVFAIAHVVATLHVKKSAQARVPVLHGHFQNLAHLGKLAQEHRALHLEIDNKKEIDYGSRESADKRAGRTGIEGHI
jgi:hypothetical protein